MSEAFLPPTDQPQNVLSDRNQRRTMANLPDVASDQYEEIGEPYYSESHQKGIAGNWFFPLKFFTINSSHFKCLKAEVFSIALTLTVLAVSWVISNQFYIDICLSWYCITA